MSKPTAIAKLASPLPSMQYATLLADGIAACQRLGGAQWTDFNEHDPGVTILEQLCYAITDASFRADLPMADLLAGAAHSDTLVTGERILSTDPVTPDDWRKLLYSRVDYLANVWLVRQDSEAFGPLYRVLVDLEDGPAVSEATATQVCRQVRELLLAHRSLGEDVDSIAVLRPFALELHGTLEIACEANPAIVLAEALLAVQDHLSPALRVTPLRQMVEAGVPYDAIFDGPLLDIGVIGDDPGERRGSTSVEEIAAVLGAVAGVTAVRGLTVVADAKHVHSGTIAIPDGCTARLAPSIYRPLPARAAYQLQLERHGARCAIEPGAVYQHVLQQRAAIKNAETFSQQQMQADPYRQPPKGRTQDLARYYSFQHQFPQVYGLGQAGVFTQGLLGQARVARQMQARQLKAYLLVFDQLLADYFAQIGNLWKLFSLDPGLSASYFSQELTSTGGHEGEPANVREWGLLDTVTQRAPVPAPEHGPVSAPHYVVYLHAGLRHPEILLRSREVATLEQARQIERDILDCGAHRHHYRQAMLIPSQFHVILDNRHGEALAFCSERFHSAEAAEHEIARLAGLIHAMACDAQLARSLLKCEARGHASVVLADADGAPLLSATHLTPGQQGRCVKALLQYGAGEEHYLVRPRRDGDLRLFLCASDYQVIAQGDQLYSSHDDARRGAQRIAALVAAIGADERARERHLHLTPKPDAPGHCADDPQHRYRSGLAAIGRRLDDFQARRNRFLDHLLARFGERFDDSALAGFDPRPAGAKQAFLADLIGWKIAFLHHCTRLGGARSRAYDYSRHASRSLASRSSLELRLFCLLGLLGSEGWEHADGPAQAVTAPYRYGRIHPAAETEPGNAFLVFCASHPNIFAELLTHGTVPDHYSVHEHRHAHGRRRYRVMFAWPEATEPLVIFETGSQAQAEREIARMIAYFGGCLEQRQPLYAGEELLLVEHVLLRPEAGHGNTDADAAFYAHRLSLVFPAWPIRFQNPAFRQFAAATAADNCPAHLAAQCYWLEAPRMAQLKQLHGEWMACKHAAQQTPGATAHAALNHSAAALRRFITALDAQGEGA